MGKCYYSTSNCSLHLTGRCWYICHCVIMGSIFPCADIFTCWICQQLELFQLSSFPGEEIYHKPRRNTTPQPCFHGVPSYNLVGSPHMTRRALDPLESSVEDKGLNFKLESWRPPVLEYPFSFPLLLLDKLTAWVYSLLMCRWLFFQVLHVRCFAAANISSFSPYSHSA